MASALRSLLDLHPSLWTGKHYAHAAGACLPSGFDALDAELPGGGWPVGSLIELHAPQDSSANSCGTAPLRRLGKVLLQKTPCSPG